LTGSTIEDKKPEEERLYKIRGFLFETECLDISVKLKTLL